MQDLKKYADQMDKCSWCEFCQATCPVYLEDLLETHVARARLSLIRSVLVEESMAVTRRFKDIVNRCMLCTNCVQTCPARIPIDEIIIGARHDIYRGLRQDVITRSLRKKFMERRGFGRLLGMGQELARRVGLSPKELPVASKKPFADRRKGTIRPEGRTRARAAYFVGCAANSFYPETAQDVVKALSLNGIEVIIPEGLVCCGMPALFEGEIELAQALARKNYEILTGIEADAVVTDCTSCGMVLKTRAFKLLPEDDPLRLKAEMTAAKTWEVTDYLNSVGLSVEPSAVSERFTYHVPCHRGWTPTMNDAPRSLLASVPQAELVEMEFPEKCCGAGGTFFMEFRDLSDSIRAGKTDDIKRTGAGTVITQCPSCRSFLAPELPGHDVIHPLSLLVRAYGI